MPGWDTALLVIDVQIDFLPGGRLAVPEGDAVIPVINRLARRFATVIATQDWHPAGHRSFASSHPGHAAFTTIARAYGTQVLWPDHCVQGTEGAALAPALAIPQAVLILRKGYRAEVDSYSAFNEADGTPTGLAGYLRERGIGRVVLAGLATDFCVGFSAVDARRAGFAVAIAEDACRGIDTEGSLTRAWHGMAAAGVERATAAAFD